MSLLHDLPPRIAASLLPGVIAKGPPGGVYLTFDDGPDSTMTPKFLRVLSILNARSTFFLTGSKVLDHPDIIAEITASHQGIGSHGMSHASLLTASRSRALVEIERSLSTIEKASGYRPNLFRPPYGRIGFGVSRATHELGLTTVLWSLSAKDWKVKVGSILAQKIITRVTDGDIILLHDSGKGAQATLTALPDIVAGIRAKGLRIASLSSVRT